MNTIANPDLRQLRLNTLRAVAALCDQHSLPAPFDVTLFDFHTLVLRLDAEDADGVARWAQILGVGEPVEEVNPRNNLPLVRAQRANYDTEQPVWLGWRSVEVWAWRPLAGQDGGDR